MKVNAANIPKEGLHLEECQDSSSWDLNSEDISYKGTIILNADFFRIGNAVNVHVRVSSHREVRCSRCLKIYSQDLLEEFNFHYKINPLNPDIEIDEDVRQEMILNFPLKPLCKSDCQGLCPHCGKDLNEGKCGCHDSHITFYYRRENYGAS